MGPSLRPRQGFLKQPLEQAPGLEAPEEGVVRPGDIPPSPLGLEAKCQGGPSCSPEKQMTPPPGRIDIAHALQQQRKEGTCLLRAESSGCPSVPVELHGGRKNCPYEQQQGLWGLVPLSVTPAIGPHSHPPCSLASWLQAQDSASEVNPSCVPSQGSTHCKPWGRRSADTSSPEPAGQRQRTQTRADPGARWAAITLAET